MTQTEETLSPDVAELVNLRAENARLKAQLTEKRRRRTVRSLLIYTSLAAVTVAGLVFLSRSVRSVGYYYYSESDSGGAFIEIDGLLEWHYSKQKGKEWRYLGSPRDGPIIKSKWE